MGHGNLSPRQKMINIMYLILTALLAMNVSAEILNAFVLVNDSLVKTEDGIRAKNGVVYGEFNAKYNANPKKVEKWKKKADAIGTSSRVLIDYIDTLQNKILRDAGEDLVLYHDRVNGGTVAIKKKDDKESPIQTMLEDMSEGKARALILKERIAEFKANVGNVLKDVEGSSALIKSMELNLSTGKGVSQYGDSIEWEHQNFSQLPLVAVITMLTKLKTDVLNTESEAINHLYNRVDAKSYKFTELNAIVKPEKSYLLSGEKYRAQIFVGASDTSLKPEIILSGGKKLERFEDGKGIYEATAGGYGMHKLEGMIVVNKPGSETLKDTFRFEEEYQVAAPSVSVSPTKMNVFYIGVDNPVEVTAAGTPADKVRVSMTSGSISKSGNGYTVRVSKPGKTKVVVTADGRALGSKEFRVKTLPDPVTTIGAPSSKFYKGGQIPRSTLAALTGINATMENFEFDLRFTVTQFIVTASIGGFDESYKSTSRKFTSRQKNLIRKAKKKSRVIIEEVRAIGPDKRTRKINDLVFKLQ